MAQCFVTFPGVLAATSATVPRTLGIVPNAAILSCAPQATAIPYGGTLTVGHGVNAITFPDMKVDFASLQMTTNGHIMTVRLLDRRWRWQFCLISGKYNVRASDGTIDPSTLATPQQLAAMLFEAMGETVYNVSQLPNTGYPEVEWIFDRADLWLHQLCEERGCDVALFLDNSVGIVRLGVGPGLVLDTDAQTPSLTADPPEGPDAVVVVCGENQYESNLRINAVGVDVDGSVKLIDQLSYTPSGGWGDIADENFFEQMRQEGRTDREIALAKKTVYRWYQVTSMADGSMNVPGYGPISSISQILPLNNHLISSYEVPTSTDRANKPAEIIGKFVVLTDPPSDSRPVLYSEYDGDFTVDRVNGIVKFPRRMVTYGINDQLEPAELYLKTSYGVRTDTTLEQVRYYQYLSITGGTFLKEAFRYEELAYATTALYNPLDPRFVIGVTDNGANLQSSIAGILQSLAARYSNVVYNQCMYRDIKLIDLNGTVRQIIWTASDTKGATTYASTNSEAGLGPMRQKDRRRIRISEMNSDIASRRFVERRLREQGLIRL